MKALIIANGALPPLQIVRKLVKSADTVVCADGGANAARKLNITPDVIVGDMDSISLATKKFFRGVPLLFIEDQNSTDLEKALEVCIQRGFTTVNVVGATGERVDHTTGSLGCFKKFGRGVELTFFDPIGEISLIRQKTRFRCKKGEKLSLIPLDRCEGVSTKNLKYMLSKEILELGIREGISNEATSSDVSIRVNRGTLLAYRFYPKTLRMKKIKNFS